MATTTTTTKATLVERGTIALEYGMVGACAIVDDPRHGRLYICEGYGGERSMAGGCVRWRDGTVMVVPAGTTLDQARKINPLDPAVPTSSLLEWQGAALENYAASLGL